MLYRHTHSPMGLIYISSLDALLLTSSSHPSPSPPSMHPSLSLPDPSFHSPVEQQLQGHSMGKGGEALQYLRLQVGTVQ